MKKFSRYTPAARVGIVVGVALVAIGVIGLVVDRASVVLWWTVIDAVCIVFDALFPVSLVALIVYLIWAYRKEALVAQGPRPTNLVRSSVDWRIAGVCGGLARWWAIDSLTVRIIVLLLFAASPALTVFIYLILTLVLPRT